MSQIRREVLNAFKKLHRTRQKVFKDDVFALGECRKHINEGFRKNQDLTNEDELKKMVQLARDVETELRTNVIQAVEKQEGVYEVRITEDTTRFDNVLFNPAAVIEKPRRRAGRGRSENKDCCGGTSCENIAEKNK